MNNRSLKLNALPWKRFLAEALLIVASVYLAIVLEAASAERDRKLEAIKVLSSLRAELALDRADGLEILALQQEQGASHEKIQAWLLDPQNVPVDAFNAALLHTLTDNRTVFPRKSSWTTMVAEGQLVVLGDPALISQLANLYEHSNLRLAYNGDRYDDTNQDMLRVWLPSVWDLGQNRFLTDDEIRIRSFANRMIQVHRQNRGYMVRVSKWLEEVESVQSRVDSYLAGEGSGH